MNEQKLYIEGSKLNHAFVDKIKGQDIIYRLTGLMCALADLEESFKKILGPICDKLNDASPDNYELLLEVFTDLWQEFHHVKYHIEEADNDLLELTNYLSNLIEQSKE